MERSPYYRKTLLSGAILPSLAGELVSVRKGRPDDKDLEDASDLCVSEIVLKST